MKTEEALIALNGEFGEEIKEVAVFLGQTSVEMSRQGLKGALAFLKQAGYAVLMDLTGVDYLFPLVRTKVVYWLHHPANLERVRVFAYVKRGESLESVVSLWEGADWYERELFDMFGIHFENHPGLTRILMPDDWEGYPMLKDYPLTEVPVLFKHGVHPKVPSEILSYEKSKQRAT
ncbi:MAG: NADH-quinone oxidoreductase subunit C [Parachlamydia sp.]|jgi:NADH-quinone oxidoreductase subunit C|nr:NADH-quinone oxidoreductase subunit C [Parachlamydia sp.]